MARINDGVLKNWLDGSVVSATEYKQEREILRTAINDNDTRITTNTTNATNLTGRVTTLETDNTENKSDIASLEGRMTSVEGVNTNQGSDISSLQTRMTNVESTNTVQSGDISTLQSRVTATESKNTAQDARLDSIESVNTSQSNEISSIGTRVSTLEGTSSTNSGRISSVESGVTSLNTRMTSVETKNTEQDNRINNIVGQTGASNTEIVDARLGSDGTAHPVLKNRLDKIEGNLIDKDRLTQNLVHGLSIFTAALNSPVEFEVQGRTLISLGNSNLEANKNYVLSGKNYKIRAEGKEGTQLTGVAKFTKNASLITKADFTSKVSGSVTENAHIGKTIANATLQSPSSFTSELATADYGRITTLNGEPTLVLSTLTNGAIRQALFSFNIIEAIERKMGRIPSDTVSGKVQWIKDNVNRLTPNWHGWGSSVGGNGATFSIWNAVGLGWATIGSHTNGTPTKLTLNATVITNYVDSNGFIHLLAYTTNPSDGVTASQLNTDFVECEIELKTTAVLDTRPIVTRVATFEGKVSGDLTSNPHKAFNNNSSTSLLAPSAFIPSTESSQTRYDTLKTLNGDQIVFTANASGNIAQQLFSFDLIAEIERNVGRIPKATVAEKVQWLKDNVQTAICDWHGFGSSVGGNKASFAVYNSSGSVWYGTKNHTNSTVTKLNIGLIPADLNIALDANGTVHFLAYADASDGVTASTINTDMISLDITLKQGTTLFDPILPLYEVDATEYANILVSWDEATVISRYPKVQSVQHLQNLAVIAEGENLLPPFSEWTLHANAVVKSPYELELNATGNSQGSNFVVPVVTGRQYTCKVESGVRMFLEVLDVNNSVVSSNYSVDLQKTITIPSNGVRLRVTVDNYLSTGKFTFTNPMLTLGNVAKPFVPRNPSYLFAPVKLGAIGDKKDILTQIDGQWNVRKLVEKDVVLDGSFPWVTTADYVGYKLLTVAHSNFPGMGASNTLLSVLKYNGILLKSVTGGLNADQAYSGTGSLAVTVSDTDTGFGETYSPLTTELQAYFNGWQAKTVDANGKPTAWKSLADGTDAPTQTLAYVSTNKAPNFTPYKISFLLATPQTINVNHLVEGAISVSGQTQVEVTSGVVVREKANPVLNSGNYHINNANITNTQLKNKAMKILTVYKNGVSDSKWSKNASTAYGLEKAFTPQTDFDPTAIYEVTYLVLDRHLMTNNATEVKASYSGSLKDVVDSNVEKMTDIATQTSINTNLIYRLLVQAKANGWSV